MNGYGSLPAMDVADSPFKKNSATFSSSFKVYVALMGAQVGCGNIWRFPRMCAVHSKDGSGAFILVWFIFLVVYAIPVLLIESTLGFFSRKGIVEAIAALSPKISRWKVVFLPVAVFLVMAYYSVIVSWSEYYFFLFLLTSLPATNEDATALWDEMLASWWPLALVWMTNAGVVFCLLKGTASLEKVQAVLIPGLVLILIVIFCWTMSLPGAWDGVALFYRFNSSTLTEGTLWVDAISQVSFDTSAGLGMYCAFSAMIPAYVPIARTTLWVPLANAFICFLCGMIIFGAVYAITGPEGQDLPEEEIQAILASSGVAGTGLTFQWMPLLCSTLPGGEIFIAFFFLVLSMAGFSALISQANLIVSCLTDIGIRRISALISVYFLASSLGSVSSRSVDFLVNQDFVWSLAGTVGALLLCYVLITHGLRKFRHSRMNLLAGSRKGVVDSEVLEEEEFLDQSAVTLKEQAIASAIELRPNFVPNDTKVPALWEWFIYCMPIEAIVLIGWFAYLSIVDDETVWYDPTNLTLSSLLLQWCLIFSILYFLDAYKFLVPRQEIEENELTLRAGSINM